jgi:hypothetical protein
MQVAINWVRQQPGNMIPFSVPHLPKSKTITAAGFPIECFTNGRVEQTWISSWISTSFLKSDNVGNLILAKRSHCWLTDLFKSRC